MSPVASLATLCLTARLRLAPLALLHLTASLPTLLSLVASRHLTLVTSALPLPMFFSLLTLHLVASRALFDLTVAECLWESMLVGERSVPQAMLVAERT